MNHPAPDSAVPPASHPATRLLRLILLVALTGAIAWAITHRDQLDMAQWESWLLTWGAIAKPVYVLLYALATILFLPGSMLTLAGGAIFGPWMGAGLSVLGATLGAGVSFLIARHLAGGWVEQRAAGMIGRLLAGVESEGWRFVAFTRLVPIFPFNLLNYALGLTRIRFDHYLITSLLCMIPGGLAYSWLGHAGRAATTGDGEAIRAGMWALGLLAIALLLPRWIKRNRETKRHLDTNTLKALLDAGDNLVVLDVRDQPDFIGENGHIPGSLNIPLPELETRLNEIRNLGKPLAIICHTDRRSKTAFRRLDTLGIGPVFLVTGGMKQWRLDRHPIEK
ncbi:MAG: VTT domain-containing protein [Magnetococcales bacterium]|nr:VTT domain-containing protein [Magnetococcales bacterium]